MAKNTTKIVSIATLTVDKNVNVRLANNYDIPQMKEAIIHIGRITDPIHVRLCDSVVLRGNRRTLAGQELLADPNCPQDVAAELKKVTVVYHDVAPGSPEELAVILDQGTQKGLSRTEILLTVWRLDKSFQSEGQIINALYFALAEYTKRPDKAQEAAAITNLTERQTFLRTWLHGTVGNYFLAANKMGEWVRDQMIKTHLSEDKLLPEGEKVEVKMSRDVIAKLSAAKSKDKDEKNGGEGWTPEEGGKFFNELVAKLKAGVKDDEGTKRPTAGALKDKADAFKSIAIRNALLLAAGETEKGKDLMELDDRLHRLSMVMETLSKRVSEIQDPLIAGLVKAIIGNGPAGEVELAINKIVSK